ncbi:MAG: restriction endonuclease subunit S [Clostridia bacterium]|nr:restriction endonuclease subunit S [Clostridia bacterium]
MNASLNEKLRTVKWGEYKLGTLFDIENTLSFNADKLVDGTEYDYVTRTSTNQGILQTTGFVNEDNINSSGTWSLGLLSMDFFYRYKPWYAGQFIRKIIPKVSIPENTVPFFSTILNKQKPILLSVLVRGVDEAFKNISVKLPQTAEGKIDFDFMESFVAELEAERVAELSAYLMVSGLDNYELSSDEKKALKNYQSLKWNTYNLEKLFGKSTRGKRLKGDDRISGTLPFVTAGEAAEGISAYISNEVEVFEKNTTTIDMFGSAKYRNYKYGADDHVAVVHTEAVPMRASIFLTSAIHKAAHTGKFDYGHNFYAKDADALDIMLPTKDGKPDYDAMSTLISAVQKLVIKDVVKYADEKTKAYHTATRHDEQNTEYTFRIKSKPLMVADGDYTDKSGLVID